MSLRGYILFLISVLLFSSVDDVFGVDKKDEKNVDGVAGVFYKGKIESFRVVDIKEIGATGNSVPERLEAVYNSVKDYSTEDYAVPTSDGVIKVNLGRVILRRCIVIFAALIILFLGLKIIPVMYSPDKELDSKFWIKPVLLALFLATYAPCMGFVDKVMRYLSFKDYTETNVAVVKDVTTVYEPRAFWRCVPIAGLLVEGGAAAHNAYNKDVDRVVDTISYGDFIAGNVDLEAIQNSYMEELARKDKVESGEELSEDEFNNLEQEGYDIASGVDGGPVTRLVMNCINDIVVFLVRILTNLIRVVQTSVLCLLFIGGPVAVVCEMIPGLEGSVKKWFGVFVRTHLITPIIFVMDVVRYHLMQANMSSGAFLYLSFSLCLIVLYFRLEKIAGYFISSEAAGVDSMAKATGAVAVAGAAVVGAGAVAVTGVAAAGATAAAGKAAAKVAGSAVQTAGKAAASAAQGAGKSAGGVVKAGGKAAGSASGNAVGHAAGKFSAKQTPSFGSSSGGSSGGGVKTVVSSESVSSGGSKKAAEPQKVSSIGQKVDPSAAGRTVRTNDNAVLDSGKPSTGSVSESSDNVAVPDESKAKFLNDVFDAKNAVKKAAKTSRKFASRVAGNVAKNAVNVVANDSDLNLVGAVAGSFKDPNRSPEDNQSHRQQMVNATRNIDEQKKLFQRINPTAQEGVFDQMMAKAQRGSIDTVAYFNPELNKFSVAKKSDVDDYVELMKNTGQNYANSLDFGVGGVDNAVGGELGGPSADVLGEVEDSSSGNSDVTEDSGVGNSVVDSSSNDVSNDSSAGSSSVSGGSSAGRKGSSNTSNSVNNGEGSELKSGGASVVSPRGAVKGGRVVSGGVSSSAAASFVSANDGFGSQVSDDVSDVSSAHGDGSSPAGDSHSLSDGGQSSAGDSVFEDSSAFPNIDVNELPDSGRVSVNKPRSVVRSVGGREQAVMASVSVDEQKRAFARLNPNASVGSFDFQKNFLQRKHPDGVVYFNTRTNKFDVVQRSEVERYLGADGGFSNAGGSHLSGKGSGDSGNNSLDGKKGKN